MAQFYKGLIEMRKAYDIFRTNNTAVSGATLANGGRAVVTIDNHMGGKAMIIMNPTAEAMSHSISGSWNVVCDGIQAGAAPIGTASGNVSVPAYSAVVLVNDNLLN